MSAVSYRGLVHCNCKTLVQIQYRKIRLAVRAYNRRNIRFKSYCCALKKLLMKHSNVADWQSKQRSSDVGSIPTYYVSQKASNSM